MSLHFRTLHTPTEHVFANLVCVFSVSRSHLLVLFAEAIFRIMLLHIMLWILCWAVHIFVHIMFTMGCLHFFCPSVLRPVKRFLAAEEPAAGEELAAEEPAAEKPAADDCVRCKNCSNDKIMHSTVERCPCCHENLSSANSESACSERCPESSLNVPDCDDGEHCTLHSNHPGECLFKFSDKAVEATDSEFEPDEDSSEAKIGGTEEQMETVESFRQKVQCILKDEEKTVDKMCDFSFFSCHSFSLHVVTFCVIFQRGATCSSSASTQHSCRAIERKMHKRHFDRINFQSLHEASEVLFHHHPCGHAV